MNAISLKSCIATDVRYAYSDKADLGRCWRSLQYPCCPRPTYVNNATVAGHSRRCTLRLRFTERCTAVRCCTLARL